jgi:hypothetical protein
MYFADLARLQRDAGESHQCMPGRERTLRICQVCLHHFIASTIAGIAYLRTHSQCLASA